MNHDQIKSALTPALNALRREFPGHDFSGSRFAEFGDWVIRTTRLSDGEIVESGPCVSPEVAAAKVSILLSPAPKR